MTSLAHNPVLQALADSLNRQCPMGKTRFATKREAKRWLARLTRTKGMHAFRCAICNGYHLGHPRGQVW
jgi:hypothetical protein